MSTSGEVVGTDNSTVDARRWPRRITVTLVATAIIISLPNVLALIPHGRAGSEVGVMMYGFPLSVGLVFGSPVLGACTLLWGLGLTKARRQGEQIPGLEWCFFGVIASVMMLLLFLLSGQYFRMVRSCVGL